jgi:hypothetical protein
MTHSAVSNMCYIFGGPGGTAGAICPFCGRSRLSSGTEPGILNNSAVACVWCKDCDGIGFIDVPNDKRSLKNHIISKEEVAQKTTFFQDHDDLNDEYRFMSFELVKIDLVIDSNIYNYSSNRKIDRTIICELLNHINEGNVTDLNKLCEEKRILKQEQTYESVNTNLGITCGSYNIQTPVVPYPEYFSISSDRYFAVLLETNTLITCST